jgi:hypothetical protein
VGVLLSASKEVEPGARTMLLLAEGLFRLDVVVLADTLRSIIRNLSDGQLEIQDGLHPELEQQLVFSDMEIYQPGHGRITFAVGRETDRVRVDATLGTLRFAQRGTVWITGQAIVRRVPES